MNEYESGIADTNARTSAEGQIEDTRLRGGIFVDAVRLTRMPMMVSDATLPGNPIVFVNEAFLTLSGYSEEELLGQQPHFMNGVATDPHAIAAYEAAMDQGKDATLELLQYTKGGEPFWAMLFASPLLDDDGKVRNHFLSFLNIQARHDAEDALKQASRELESRVAERTEELRKLVAERELLMTEVNHRAKNSLAVAASILDMQVRRQSDPAVVEVFAEIRERITSMARLHDLLSRGSSVQHVDLAAYIADLCESIKALNPSDRIKMHMSAEYGINVKADTAFPLGIVITELITNCVKYAFPEPNTGEIVTSIERDDNGWATLLVRDNGVGMGEVRAGSLGYGLVRALVKQINGQIEIEHKQGVGVLIKFPAPVLDIAA
ncbi:sensor histidine kinase [Sphingomonas sp.]|jgi:PAS domain S-box-containing protein|uniref:sensor histidine kinase n=1 Tax=Sphingomonas sp. TaxID=28214 RepID=UPI002DE6EE48|nr:histidine kinase dimerization/phosphoacceptor domain -containing protein [Sphingomonas sp.]